MDVQDTATSIFETLQSWIPSAVSLLTVNTLSAVFVARAATYKNRSWFSFFWLSLIATSLVMSIIVAALPTADEHLPNRRKCPNCAEYIRNEASMCRYCGSKVDAVAASNKRLQKLNPRWLLGVFTIALALVVIILALTKVFTDSLWLGLALLLAGGAMLWRVPRRIGD